MCGGCVYTYTHTHQPRKQKIENIQQLPRHSEKIHEKEC